MDRIALFGGIGAGKSFASQCIKDNLPNTEILSFAKPMKVLAEEILKRPINKSTDRLFISHLGQSLKSEELKFMGWKYLYEFMILSSKDLRFSDDNDRYLFNKNLHINLKDFITNNPNWGYENFWTDFVINEINNLKEKNIIIDDLRFKHEYNALINNGFKIYKVTCPEEVRVARIIARDGKFNPQSDLHPSELEWPKFPKGEYEELLVFDQNKYEQGDLICSIDLKNFFPQ